MGLGTPTCFRNGTMHTPGTDDRSKIQCDTVTEGCDNTTLNCQPKTKSAECPSGFVPFTPVQQVACPELRGKCCQLTGFGGTTCNSDLLGALNPTEGGYCANVKKFSNISDGFCASDGKISYRLGPDGLCAAAKKTPIFLCLADSSCDTAIGTILTQPGAFVEAIMKLVVGVSGGIALLMLIIAGYNILTSAGDPQKLAAGKEIIVSVITGIILIVFSMVILKAIGVDLLGLPSIE